jgi:hypothetical protein
MADVFKNEKAKMTRLENETTNENRAPMTAPLEDASARRNFSQLGEEDSTVAKSNPDTLAEKIAAAVGKWFEKNFKISIYSGSTPGQQY